MVELEFEFKQFISTVGVCIHYAITHTHTLMHTHTDTNRYTHILFHRDMCYQI